MRNRALHDALRDFALEAAAELTRELRDGAEIPFEVVEEPGGGSVLYRYNPLTRDFIGARWDSLRRLPACAPAAAALGSGAELYLRIQGDPGPADAEPALRAMLERLYQDATSFEFPEDRFGRVYTELEHALYEGTLRTAIVAPVDGLVLERDRCDLGEGTFLIAGDKLDAPVHAVWGGDDGALHPDESPRVLCVVRRDIASDEPLPLAAARHRFRTVLRTLRLLRRGGVALGSLAHARVDDGPWQPLPLPEGGGGRDLGSLLGADEELELRELLPLVEHAPATGRVHWALERFEMGLARAHLHESLTDHVLALEALFDADDDAGRASLPLRVAALCAEGPDRPGLTRRLGHALTIERRARAATGAAFDPDDGFAESPARLAAELEDCLRALLRDVLCGYLDPALRNVADEILISTAGPVEIHAADLRADGDRAEAEEREPLETPPADPEEAVAPEQDENDPREPVAAAVLSEVSTEEWAAPEPAAPHPLQETVAPQPPPEPPARPDAAAPHPLQEALASQPPLGTARQQTPDAREPDDRGVTESIDWDDFSAPV